MKSVFKFLFVCLLCINSLTISAKDGVIYKTHAGVNFVNGGISEEQANDIRRIAKNFSLQVLFSLGKAGAWIPDARLALLDGNGKIVFSKQVAGPLLYIDLPAGDYQIIGWYNNVRQSMRITLTDEKPTRIILNWVDESEEYEVNSKLDTSQ